MKLTKVTTWTTIKPGTKIYTKNPKEVYVSINGNQCHYFINDKKLPGDIFLVGESYLATSDNEYFVEDESTDTNKIKEEKADKIIAFVVGFVYTANHQSFQIKITKRTDKTVWFENVVNGVSSGFCSQGKKRVQARYGKEVIIDGMYQYSAT